MCTAIALRSGDGYFGRNLDYESDFGEKVVVVPRKLEFKFSTGEVIKEHYGIIGMAVVENGCPLFFDGINEAGLGAAGLRFKGNAVYRPCKLGKDNVASYEVIPWILSKCKSTDEAERLLENANITDKAFSDEMPPSPLHWIIADKKRAITLEQTEKGLYVYENPVGVLTNNPEFPEQMQNLTEYMTLSSEEPQNNFSKRLDLKPYSRGMGAIGMPGDWSSASRFVKTSFVCENSIYNGCEEDIVTSFFHTLYSVFMQKGCVRIGQGYEVTNYTSCCNLAKGIYYYTTYESTTINAVDMRKANLDGKEIMEFELIRKHEIYMQN